MLDQQVGGTTEQQTVRTKTELLEEKTEMISSNQPGGFD
jgi:hypothetical protein